MTYVATPEQNAAHQRLEDARKQKCLEILARYEKEKIAKIEEQQTAVQKEKQKAVIAFQTGRKYYKNY